MSMVFQQPLVLLSWVQIMCSLVGGACLTVGMWLVSTASVVSRVPFTWVFGAMLFAIATSMILISIVVVSVHRDSSMMRLFIFVGVLSTATCGWSVVVMYQHPLIAKPTPCPAGTYGASDLTTCLPCQCVHGKCSDGREGDGTCDCDVRWRGTHCDRCDQHVQRNMADPDGPTKCDFCEPGWAMPSCKTCYYGYEGDECDKCSDTVQRYELVTVEEFAPPGWGNHSEWGLNPWGERRDYMVALYGEDEVNNVNMLRCDGCKRKGDIPTGEVVRNTRFCTEVNCQQMDPSATVAENTMPDEIQFTDTDCVDDYDCPSWYCFKSDKTPKGKCAAFSREKMGCDCATFGAVGPLCLFCDAVSDVRSCGEGNCIWNVFDQPWLKTFEAVNSTYGQVECMCRNGSDVGEPTWTRYPKDLTDRREFDGTLNLKNASCTKRTDVRACTDNTFGKHCLPCKCSGHGLCAETIDGDGSCKCTLDNTFSLASNGMWGGELCDQCLPNCSLSDDCIVQYETGYGGADNNFDRCEGAQDAMKKAMDWDTLWGYIYDA